MNEDPRSGGSFAVNRAIEEFLGNSSAPAGMRGDLVRFSMKCGGRPFFTLTTEELRDFVMGVKKAADRKKRVEALDGFFNYAKERGWVIVNPITDLIKKKEPRIKPVSPSEKPVWLSAEGFQRLEAEIDGLLKERAKAIAEVKRTREDGDLRENAPYHAARERLAWVESRATEIRAILARAHPSD
ncbi:MAG: Transcription elongation factor GreA [Dehalococcoidia bacterium]|nr:Transcription elongation factor GreA [Chloroflexota bacterium]